MKKNNENKEIDKRESLKIVAKNDFITAKGLPNLSLKSRKLLYLAAAQCRMNDREFYEYDISVKEFANLMGIAPTNIYQEITSIKNELMSSHISIENGQDFDDYGIFSMCSYREKTGILHFKLNKDMTDFFLNLRGNFTQAFLSDFMKMKSPYSMAIWHLFLREMKSKKPQIGQSIYFTLSIDELRKVTGLENQYQQIGQFKTVLDKAIREIKDNSLATISYKNQKEGRSIIGFEFKVDSWYMPDYIPDEKIIKRVRYAELKKIKKERPLTSAENDEYQSLIMVFEQMTFEDFNK